MKNLLLALLILFNGVLFAQQDPFYREKMWQPEIDNFIKQDNQNPPPKNAILFVGSSSIRMWNNIESYFPKHSIISRGVGGSHLEDIIFFADKIVFPYSPKQIVLYEGDNDIKDGFTPESYLEEVKVFVRMCEIRLPTTPIIILSIKVCPARANLLPTYQKANKLLSDFAKRKKNVEFVDISTVLLTKQNTFRTELFLKDQLHITNQAYKLWADLISPYLLPTNSK